MGAGAPNGDTQNQGYLRSQHPYVYRIGWLVLWAWAECGKSLSIIFAQWPSMHDPIKYLLNVADHHEADTLTEKWVQGKLQELQYVGLSGALVTGTIASAFSWFSVPDDPWSTQACWTSALLLGFTAIAVATQQTIGLARLCSCEDGWLKVRCLLGEKNPFYGSQDKRPYFSHHRMHREDRVRMKKSQLWIWQTPVMLLNFAILLFVVGLMIAIFVRASRTHWDWSKGQIQIAIFFGCAVFFSGTNYLICWICLNAGSLQSESERIDTVYIIPPETEDYTDALIEFVDLAVDVYGVKRGGDADNYKGPQYVHTIKNEGKIYSACGDGKIPFVSTKDIAAVAFRALTDEKAWNTDVRVLGGELLSLDDVAAKFTKALNKPVEHVKLSEKEMGNLYRETGMPGHIADLIAWMEAYSATGVEERMSDTVEKVTGRMPVRFEEMIEESREVWL
ncbi:uncharacterized protein KY384_003466 [Bacidia gigantensis]|uniref:uncharacterized protein n=1 Tax=Bacidia gigantensis TaxID=2732470 RepID=UPI001D0461A4|nr:uncharacterized protein KY384_003466 [Bacidia gigantensis]KAG8531830.1 hypothetical protein KY384_003466 [Bacidia gigantensis]